MANFSATVDRARQLFEDAQPTNVTEWRNLPYDQRGAFIELAAKQLHEEAQAAAEVEARRVKLAQVDAYRARIAGTIPAHRLDTRMTGFLDGWDAAMRYMQEQG